MSLHLFLSPHLDDAILSCGGAIHQLAWSGERVIIVTAMAGEPQEPLPDSPVVQTIRVRWNSGDFPLRARRAEDIRAAQQLGAQVYHLPLLEAAFRGAVCGIGDWVALYPDYDSPFQGIADADEARVILFETRLAFAGVATIYAPLGVDEHVDHQLVRDWALVLTGSNDAPVLKFYEEIPHARSKPALQRAQAFYRQHFPTLAMASEVIALTDADLDARLRAMGCYQSHLHVLWNDPAEMEALTREYLMIVGDGTPADDSGASLDEESLMAGETLAQAQSLLKELIDAANTGAIIPVRLPGQLEAIQQLLEQAAGETSSAAAQPPAPPAAAANSDEFLKEQAAFVSHAVHELRTPLTSIRGYSDMLRSMGALNDMQKQSVETIRNNSRRMETLLTDVSDTAKLKGNVLRSNLKMDMFKNIALMVEKQAQPLTEELGRKLTFDIPQGLPILNVDGELLAKAIYKLVENGLRYSRENGEVTIHASAESNKLTITVQDNGIGMTPEELDQLGTIYFRADNDVVRSFKGSGLGIPVAYGIIHLLSGTITVQSEPDKGTTFTMILTGMT